MSDNDNTENGENQETTNTNLTEFKKIVNDFLTDLLVTFSDKILNTLNENLKRVLSGETAPLAVDNSGETATSRHTAPLAVDNNGETATSCQTASLAVDNSGEEEGESENKSADNDALTDIYAHCSAVLPERFFDILYQNQEIFSNPEIDCCFLPGIDFKDLWFEEISDKTRESIWKYLQLLLFSIVTNVENKTSFGKTAQLFEAIDETEFKDKLEDTIKGLENMFGTAFGKTETCNSESEGNNVPNPKEIQDHISGIMNGKLGNLAKELAEETAKDFDLTGENITDVKDVFQTLFKNPQKLMNLVKNVGSKLDEKMKSGDINESELLEEATNMFNNMKNMPGMPQGMAGGDGMAGMQDLLNNFNIPELMKNMGMMPGNAKFNENAFNAKMEQNIKTSKAKERMRSKLEQNQEKAKEQEQSSKDTNIQSNIQKNLDFILNNKNTNNSNNELGVLNDSLQSLVEQMKLQNESQQNPQPQNPKKRKPKNKKG